MNRCVFLLLAGTLPLGCQTNPAPKSGGTVSAEKQGAVRKVSKLPPTAVMLADSASSATPAPAQKESTHPAGETRPAGRIASWWPHGNLEPGENAAVFGIAAGLLGRSIAGATGATRGEAIAIGAAAGAIAGTTASVVAKHKATERQQRIAEQRARVNYDRFSPQKKMAMRQKRVRYLAVDTEQNEATFPHTKRAVMIWDTQTESIVGNRVYDVQQTPSIGSRTKFDSYSAEYVGSGN